jgi:hypothetical protein
MTTAWTAQRTKGIGAMYAFLDNCHTHYIHPPYIVSQLFDKQALSVMGYGCEVWGPGAFFAATTDTTTMCDNEFEHAHNISMRQALCVGQNTRKAVMRHVLNQIPVLAVWIPRMLDFWNRLLKHDLLARSLQSHLDQPGSWGHRLLHLISLSLGECKEYISVETRSTVRFLMGSDFLSIRMNRSTSVQHLRLTGLITGEVSL